MRDSGMVLAVVVLATGCSERGSKAPPPEERKAEEQPSCSPGKRGCVNDDVVQCNADGSLGRKLETCKGQCRGGACVDTCALQDAELIYVVDRNSRLFSFDPRKLPEDPFHSIATLDCGESRTLNSMAVDRSGIAWLDYHSGVVHRASIIDGHCSPGSTPRGAPKSFGMGFVTDGPDTSAEKLFVAGEASLAILDTSTTPGAWMNVATIAVPGAHPELTGTSEGRLFAYFPEPGRGFITELDRTTGKTIGERWVLMDPAEHVSAYAFAHWGGVFYVFTTADGVTSVHAVQMATGKQKRVSSNLDMVIVGAGVSTCAPLLEQPL